MDISGIFDWAEALGKSVRLSNEISALREKIRIERDCCGSCIHWMTRACPREKHDNMTGRSRGPSMVSLKCGSFFMKPISATLIVELEKEIEEIKEQMKKGGE